MELNALTRFVQFACVLALFGTVAWQLVGPRSPPAIASGPRALAGRLFALFAAGCLVGAAATMGWLFAEAKMIGGAWSAVGGVIASTRFGQVAMLRAALLVLCALVVWTMRRSRALWGILGTLTALAVVSFVWTGHGTSGAASGLHAFADALHLFCAALWLGALLALSISAARAFAGEEKASGGALLAGLLRFSAIGPALIALLIATGVVNTWLLVGPGRWGELLRQPYGWALICKLALFAGMLALAVQHRYHSTPPLRQALASGSGAGFILGGLRRTLLIETLLALLVLAAVAVLGMLEPPASLS